MTREQKEGAWMAIAFTIDILIVGVCLWMMYGREPAPNEIRVNVPRSYFKSEEGWERNKASLEEALIISRSQAHFVKLPTPNKQ